ncbi:hypothetical protein BpHYR1_018356 [Brachionus plicatilis]|uniref:Uncharacterized protein n=1 Tax=Brachionus plicatilis TaxID=10195 RepID=A0A3M7PC31_BRAPC|nr:hypothetical protein BpHYR1_018356 [Brachionus plicatilis]
MYTIWSHQVKSNLIPWTLGQKKTSFDFESCRPTARTGLYCSQGDRGARRREQIGAGLIAVQIAQAQLAHAIIRTFLVIIDAGVHIATKRTQTLTCLIAAAHRALVCGTKIERVLHRLAPQRYVAFVRRSQIAALWGLENVDFFTGLYAHALTVLIHILTRKWGMGYGNNGLHDGLCNRGGRRAATGLVRRDNSRGHGRAPAIVAIVVKRV